ncbi:MAG: hypothetical protein ACYC3W_10575 [Candidatus Nanopelagicales bacterium]
MSDQMDMFGPGVGHPLPSVEFKQRRGDDERLTLKYMNDCCPRCSFKDYAEMRCVHYMDFEYWLKAFIGPDEDGKSPRAICRFFLSAQFRSHINDKTPLPYLVDKPHDTAKADLDAVPDSDIDDGLNRPCRDADSAP